MGLGSGMRSDPGEGSILRFVRAHGLDRSPERGSFIIAGPSVSSTLFEMEPINGSSPCMIAN